MNAARLEEILRALSNARVGVLGDFCLDVYWFIDPQASEISVETGKPTHPVREQRYSLGGAGNVVANLRALGVGRVCAFGVLGADPFGERQRALLRQIGADPEGMLTAGVPEWQTLAYTKPYCGDEELPRFDMGNFNRLQDACADRLLERLEASLANLDVVIVNQQVRNGIHTPHLRDQLQALILRHKRKTFLYDGRHFTDAYPAAWLKLNAHEACRLCGLRKEQGEPVLRQEALAAGQALFARAGNPIFVTRGDRGCLVVSRDGIEEVPGLLVTGPTDPVGAGDSFLAGIAAAIAVRATAVEAARLGNLVAGVTVSKLRQTGTASPAEVLRIGREPDYVFEPELADNPRWARPSAPASSAPVRP